MNKKYPYRYKFVPQNYLAEEILLGTFLVYPDTLQYTNTLLKKEYFFLESHEVIYISLIENNDSEGLNVIKLLHLLKIKGLLTKIGGIQKLINMMRQSQIFIFSSNINNYTKELIKILNTNYIKRLIIQYGYNIIKLGTIPFNNSAAIYNKILFYLKFIEKEVVENNEDIINIKNLLSTTIIEIKNSQINSKNGIQSSILKSGFSKLDKIITGLPKGNLIIVAGRPSVGKTSFAINIAYNVFLNAKTSICIFSLEMSSKEILHKFMSIALKQTINDEALRMLTRQQWKSINKIFDHLIHKNVYINDRNNVQIDYINYTTNIIKKNKNLGLVIIDYLQLIELTIQNTSKNNRSQELGYITRKLKLLAQNLNLPIIVLSQLNRNIEIRSNKEPLLSDLKESGCISCSNNISLSDNSRNNININNLLKINTHYLKLSILYNQLFKYRKHKIEITTEIENLYFFKQYIFKCHIRSNNIRTSYNHKQLYQTRWTRVSKNSLSTKINFIKNRSMESIYFDIYKKYIQHVKTDKYNFTYDIDRNRVFNILCHAMILHNSIEQDADIILMLYDKQEKEFKNTNQKTLDIKVSKNRNGITGSCQIIFVPASSIFQDIINP
uniref:DNA 5'-3' helicase n=1 Tax=Digenea simplex TaxID=945030 RepID=A0A1Z1MUH6_DIGSM|nr:Replication helicase subunit [Digenea simplex]ARW69616.1 Replication helicase subunit [Digenea simplex]